mmetsp:Transcript_89620/g.256025  ORF Transcript_89620/g.256025 Transcript_89620/m.256025 type:complete len:115 (-) Transcript_89620:77-421(-)
MKTTIPPSRHPASLPSCQPVIPPASQPASSPASARRQPYQPRQPRHSANTTTSQDFSAQPNDQRTEFNFKRTSSVKLDVMGSDDAALDDIIGRLRTLVDVMESAEGSLTEVPSS